MTALEKFTALSRPAAAPSDEDPAAELVRAALSAAAELGVMLAKDDPDDDGDDDSSGKDGGPGDTDDDAGHVGHPMFKALKKKGVADAMAAKMCARADKRVKATALADAITVALSGLATASGDWVELTAFDQRGMVALAAGGAKDGAKSPYGDVQYADPGYQEDGKKRYPVDTPEHTRAAWSYINQGKDADKYKGEHLNAIKGKIRSAAKKHGIQIGEDSSDKVAATMVELAMKQAEEMQMMHHGPMTGRHSHGHAHQVVVNEEHFHNNDSDHSRHTPAAVQDRW
jgi:hypothetical protein